MKIRNLILMMALVFIIACKNNKAPSSPKNETYQLETIEGKRTFLEQILKDDQLVRDGEKAANLVLKYGKDSKEDLAYAEAQWKQDAINLQKIEGYLKEFGYPKKAELGEDAAITPWLVIHHSTDIEVRNRYFEVLYKAYLTEDIDDTAMSMYLGRTHQFTFREMFDIESPYLPEDEINQLIQKLGLEDKKTTVQKGMEN